MLLVALMLPGLVFLSGCLPTGRRAMNEEKDPYFLQGKSLVNSMDYKGAINAFEKALQSNPRSSGAHFELACLYEKREADPAAAIYHFQQFLKLQPRAENAEIINEHIMGCKQELARTVSLGPVTERQQREFEQLLEENKHLRGELDKYHALEKKAQQVSNVVSAPVIAPPPVLPPPMPLQRPVAMVAPASTNSAVRVNPARTTNDSQTHVIQGGETLNAIARKYGIKVEALMAANPRIEARRLRPGQMLLVPVR
jgi:LysM repeat protein